MASDEELARRIAEAEDDGEGAGGSGDPEGYEAFRSTAKEVHDELARRVDRVDDRAVDEAALEAVVDRLDRLEARLDDLDAEG